nr:PH domain-containing protein [Propionibacterium sp.]
MSETTPAAPDAGPEPVPSTGVPPRSGWDPHPNPPRDPLFAPPGGVWNRLSPRYVRVRQAGALAWTLVLFGPAAGASLLIFGQPWVTAGLVAVGVLWGVWRVLRARRWVESWGWAERDQDLCITHGLWFRQLVVVPFGRMQVVNVTSGPLLRSQGLAEVHLVTAAALSDAKIPGLAQADAIALRDRMIELSDARGAGL